jgi:hypothetical protein
MMFSLAELYPLLTERYEDIPEVQQGIIRIAWNYCVGERIRKAVQPLFFQNGILTVRVSGSQWKTTIASLKPEICSRMNRYLKRNLIQDVRIEAD